MEVHDPLLALKDLRRVLASALALTDVLITTNNMASTVTVIDCADRADGITALRNYHHFSLEEACDFLDHLPGQLRNVKKDTFSSRRLEKASLVLSWGDDGLLAKKV